MKIQQLSKMALLAVVAISLIIFGLFFGCWGDEKYGEYDAPTFTGLLLYLMYALVVLTTGLIVWAMVKSMAGSKGAGSLGGVPGTKISVCTWGLFVLSLVVGYVTGIGEADFTAADGTVTAGSMVTVVDMFMTSIIVLFLALVAAVVVGMSGILTKTASK